MPGVRRVTLVNNSIKRNQKETNKEKNTDVLKQLVCLSNGDSSTNHSLVTNGDHCPLPVIIPKVLHVTEEYLQNGFVYDEPPKLEVMKRIVELDSLTRRSSNASSDVSTNGSNSQLVTRSSSERCFHCKGSLLGGSTRLCKRCCENDVPIRRMRQCLLCHSVMPNEFYQGHVLSHQQNVPFKCTYCQLGFSNADEIREHAKIHIAESLRKWQLLQKEIMQKSYNKKHALSLKSVNRAKQILFKKEVEISCNLCGKLFSKQYHKQRHLSDVHGALMYSCPDCNRQFPSVRYLNKHIKQTTGKKYSHKCTVCAKMFRSNACLLFHRIEFHGKSKSKSKSPESDDAPEMTLQDIQDSIDSKRCYICKKNFTTVYHTRRHIRDLHSTVVYKCQDCNKKFPCNRYLRMHRQKTTNVKLKCNICMKEFLTTACLLYHKSNSHSKKKRLMLPLDDEQKENKQTVKKSTPKVETISATSEDGKPIRFTCKFCRKGFSYRMAYRRHIMVHTTGVGRKCTYCGVIFQKKTELSNHIRVNHTEKSLTTVINRLEVLAKQQKKRLGNKVTTKSPAVPSQSENSSPTSSGSQHLCTVCNKLFSSKSNLQRHSLIHGSASPNLHKCSFCSKVFSHLKHKRQHEYNHSKAHTCHVCNRTFAWRYLLTKHNKALHSKEISVAEKTVTPKEQQEVPALKCTLCKSVFKTQVYFDLHMQKIHKQPGKSNGAITKVKKAVHKMVIVVEKSSEKMIKCTHCRKTFPSHRTLNRHILHQHENQNSKNELSCKTCGQKFVKRGNYENHLKTAHVIRKPFRCKKCNIPLKSKLQLIAHNSKNHPKTSSGFSCSKCGENFYRNIDLKKHQIVHSDTKALFKCPMCNIVFKTKKAWVAHDAIHKPFNCLICGKRFSKKVLLRKHNFTHQSKETAKNETTPAKSEKFSCDLCKGNFINKYTLIRHRNQVHGLLKQ